MEPSSKEPSLEILLRVNVSGFLEIFISQLGNYVDWSKRKLNCGSAISRIGCWEVGSINSIRKNQFYLCSVTHEICPGMKFFVLDKKTFA